jgi:hypothetical protein
VWVLVTSETLTATDPEPPAETAVIDSIGGLWLRREGYDPGKWIRFGHDEDLESWTKVAGNYGPVTVVGPDRWYHLEQEAETVEWQYRLRENGWFGWDEWRDLQESPVMNWDIRNYEELEFRIKPPFTPSYYRFANKSGDGRTIGWYEREPWDSYAPENPRSVKDYWKRVKVIEDE